MKKKITVSAIIIFIAFSGKAQPNGGFENWHNEFSYQTPDDWQTFNFLTLTTPPNPISAFKASGIDKHSGNFALKVKSIHVINNPIPQGINDTVGYVFTGQLNVTPASIRYGFPYTGRPEKLEFWAKYAPVGIDTGGAAVILRKWNGTGNDTIAYGTTKITATPSYTLFQVNLTYYLANEIPDSAAIFFASSKSTQQARVGSTLYVDDVSFLGYVGIAEKESAEHSVNVKVFPNPAKEHLTFQTTITEADQLQVTDVAGKLIGVYSIQDGTCHINTSMYAVGTCFYSIFDNKKTVLIKGRFNVVK